MPFKSLLYSECLSNIIVAVYFNSCILKRLNELRQEQVLKLLIYKECLCCIADRHILCLCIYCHLQCRRRIRINVNICMADTVSMSQYGDVCVLHYVLDKRIRTSGDNEVDILVKL